MPGLESKGAPALEGDYSAFSLQWVRDHDEYWGFYLFMPARILAYEDADVLILCDTYAMDCVFCKLSNGDLIRSLADVPSMGYSTDHSASFNKYMAHAWTEDGTPVVKIYRNGVLLQTIDVEQEIGWSSWSFVYLAITMDGKYLVVKNEASPRGTALFKGR